VTRGFALEAERRDVGHCEIAIAHPHILQGIGGAGDDMTTILTGRFDDFEVAENAQSDLRRLGLAEGQMQVFEFTAPGQRDRHPLGGEEYADRSAQGGGTGAVTGAAVGGVAGLALGAAAIPLAGPLAAATGSRSLT
jgi:hypothetical protein